MRNIRLYSDLECTNLVTTVVTQDYVLPENKQLYTAITSGGSTYADAKSWTVSQLPEPVVYTTAYVAEGSDPSEQTGSFMSDPVIAGSTVAFPLGEPTEEAEIKSFYIEGGVRIDYVNYYDSENDQLRIGIWAPKYFTGWSEDEEPQPQFDSIWISGPTGSNLLWVGSYNTTTEIVPFSIANYSSYSDVRVIFVEGDVYFKKTTYPPIGKFETAFIPVIMGTINGDLHCLNGYPDTYPAAISVNGITSDEIIPPAPDESGESSGINRDGTGTGIGVSDPADTINVAALNSGALNWNGHGSGLTYYAIDLATFTRDVVGKVYGTLFSNSLEAWNQAIDSVIYPTADSFAINAETIRACIVSAYLLPNIPVEGSRTNEIWVGPLKIDVSNSLTNYVGDRYQTLHDVWLTGVTGHEDFPNEGFGDFNDFTNTTATLHLPFVGDIPIDVCSFNRGNIRVKTVLDQFTGNISYEVHTISMEANGGVEILYGIYSGNCAVEQPICSIGSSANVLSRIVNAGSQAVGAAINVASGNFVNAGMGAFSAITAADTAVASREVVNRGGVLDKNTGPLQTDAVTLQITRPIPLKPYNRVEIEGIPAATKQPIRQFTGFLKVKSCDLKGLSCEDPEKDKIMALLKEGVYI